MAERATVARPYAKAAFAYAREQGKLDPWSRWLGTARSVVLSDQYAAYERSSRVQTRQLLELIAGVVGDALDPHGRAFLELLAENGRLDYLPEIADRFQDLKDDDANVADVQVTSAVGLDEARSTAVEEGKRIVESSRQDAQQEKSRARDELRKDVATLAVAGASRLLQREIDPRAHADLIEQLARDIEGAKA